MMKSRNQVLENAIRRCRERNIIIPTYREMASPQLAPDGIKKELSQIGLWDLQPRNLFRTTWKNEPVEFGGGFGDVNCLELPSQLTGVKARIFVLIGKFFPTGSHKVGATFGPLVERLVSGEFDPTTQKALWPSTGNYCRGGAYDSRLLGCDSIAVLPEEMSKERFDWLHEIGAEVITTPGCESNVKEIYDKVKALEAERGDRIVTLNQFEEFGNPRWHYAVTGPAMEEAFKKEKRDNQKFTAIFLCQGSAGTLGCADYLRTVFPLVKVGAGEAIQCPTLLHNGYGAHRIEGIGDKHVPWIHNLKNMDMVVGIDDEVGMRLMRLFNEPAGRRTLIKNGVDPETTNKLDLLGISAIANVMGAVKMAKFYEMNENDTILTVATDSMEMYRSRIREQRERFGEYTEKDGSVDYEGRLMALTTDAMLELSYYDKKRMHNLKYFTWVEQHEKPVEELDAQWYDESYWKDRYSMVGEWDEKIAEFNDRAKVLIRV